MSFEKLFNAKPQPKDEPANKCPHLTANLEYIGPTTDALNMVIGLQYRCCECGEIVTR